MRICQNGKDRVILFERSGNAQFSYKDRVTRSITYVVKLNFKNINFCHYHLLWWKENGYLYMKATFLCFMFSFAASRVAI